MAVQHANSSRGDVVDCRHPIVDDNPVAARDAPHFPTIHLARRLVLGEGIYRRDAGAVDRVSSRPFAAELVHHHGLRGVAAAGRNGAGQIAVSRARNRYRRGDVADLCRTVFE